MKAGLRSGMMAFATGFWLGAPAFAQSLPQNTTQNGTQPTRPQSAPPPTNTTQPATTVGPRELQNFSLGGTATRPTVTPSPATTAPTNPGFAPLQLPSREAPASGPARSGPGERGRTPLPPARSESLRQSPQPVTPSFAPTDVGAPPPASAPDQSSLSVSTQPHEQPASPTLSPAQGPVLWPWLLGAIVVAAGIAFMLWRRRPREAVAGVESEYFEAPSEAPVPIAPRPAPPRRDPGAESLVRRVAAEPRPLPPVQPPIPAASPAPATVGMVSARLRPWLDVSVMPVACRIDNQSIGFDFDIEVLNSGSAPARETRIEATLFNAGPNQEEGIAAFMAKPTMESDPLPPIGPLQRSNFRLSLQASRASIEQFEVGGRQLFVPVIAFNATYHWSSGAGQTSGSALLGRESGAEKLAPLRVDVGNGAFAGLGTRVLPTGVRR